MDERIYLSLGSNVGDRLQNLRTAVAHLSAGHLQKVRLSSIYETEPVDYLDQSWFLNCVLQAETQLPPAGLLSTLRQIESRMGSKKEFAKGPRLIDIDILLYGQHTIDLPGLQVPHPRMLSRKFVLVPLAEIAPQLTHPLWPSDVTGLLQRTSDDSQVRRIDH